MGASKITRSSFCSQWGVWSVGVAPLTPTGLQATDKRAELNSFAVLVTMIAAVLHQLLPEQ